MDRRLRNFFRYFGLAESEPDAEWEKWYNEQRNKLASGGEIEPPWISFPNSSPIHGWNQGYQEEWKNKVWVIFWNKLDAAEQVNYLSRWKPPSEDWRETITVYWK